MIANPTFTVQTTLLIYWFKMCDSVLFKNNTYINSQEQTWQFFVKMKNIHAYIQHKKNIRISNKENPFDINKCFGDLMTVNFSKLKKKYH